MPMVRVPLVQEEWISLSIHQEPHEHVNLGGGSGEQGTPNKALQQNRGDVLRYGESIGCDLLKATVLPPKAARTMYMYGRSVCC